MCVVFKKRKQCTLVQRYNRDIVPMCFLAESVGRHLKCTNLLCGYVRTYTIELPKLTGLQADGSKSVIHKYIVLCHRMVAFQQYYNLNH